MANITTQTFQGPGFGLTAHIDDHGEPWFRVNEVCEILEHSNPSQAVATNVLDKKDINSIDTLTAGGIQKALYVNETGLYALIFGSRKKEAIAFKRWVFDEVLPEIRKTGGYNPDKKQATRELELTKPTEAQMLEALNQIGRKPLGRSLRVQTEDAENPQAVIKHWEMFKTIQKYVHLLEDGYHPYEAMLIAMGKDTAVNKAVRRAEEEKKEADARMQKIKELGYLTDPQIRELFNDVKAGNTSIFIPVPVGTEQENAKLIRSKAKWAIPEYTPKVKVEDHGLRLNTSW